MLLSLALPCGTAGMSLSLLHQSFPSKHCGAVRCFETSLLQVEPALSPQPELAGQCSSPSNLVASPAPYRFVDISPPRVPKQDSVP